jgi:hypothetical protein
LNMSNMISTHSRLNIKELKHKQKKIKKTSDAYHVLQLERIVPLVLFERLGNPAGVGRHFL